MVFMNINKDEKKLLAALYAKNMRYITQDGSELLATSEKPYWSKKFECYATNRSESDELYENSNAFLFINAAVLCRMGEAFAFEPKNVHFYWMSRDGKRRPVVEIKKLLDNVSNDVEQLEETIEEY